MFPEKNPGAHRSISAAIGRCAKHNASVTNWKDKRTAYNYVFEYEGQMQGYTSTGQPGPFSANQHVCTLS
jgi:hypothetical protein